eukprot:12820077-Alexandrium_andersonii.AAC.1
MGETFGSAFARSRTFDRTAQPLLETGNARTPHLGLAHPITLCTSQCECDDVALVGPRGLWGEGVEGCAL